MPVQLLALLFAAAGLQQPPLVFGTHSDLVNINITVTDAATHEYMADLEASDFTVFEHGARQSIAVFHRQMLPIDLVLMVDVSNSMDRLLTREEEAAAGFIATLRPQDRARIVAFGAVTNVLQDWTSDHAALITGIQAMRIGGDTRLYNALSVIGRELQHHAPEEDRVRVIIILTDGLDTGSLLTDDQAINDLARSGALVYPIELPQDASSGYAYSEAARQAHLFLSRTAQGTGGRLSVLHTLRDLTGAYDSIAQELRMQYRIGYVPLNTNRDGAWRTISVLVNRPNALPRHRSGYFAPRP